MFSKTLLTTLASFALAISSTPEPVAANSNATDLCFIKPRGTQFVTEKGCPFHFVGANNYYLPYKSKKMVDAVFEDTKKLGMTVVRTWAFMDNEPKEGVVFQTFSNNAATIHNGENGLERLDYVVYKARSMGIRLVLTLVNNWAEMGGMDSYVKAFGGKYHDDFYKNEKIKDTYKAYVKNLMNRKNKFTGIAYKDDPTIFSWQLTNEARCKGTSMQASPECNPRVITNWASEMCQFIKSVDKNHMVSLGDEGFFTDGAASEPWPFRANEGIDYNANLGVQCLDYGVAHLYADAWIADVKDVDPVDFGLKYIKRHIDVTHAANRPFVLEEYGLQDQKRRPEAFKKWQDMMIKEDVAGFMVWMLSSIQDDGTLYPDYDKYTVYARDAPCKELDADALITPAVKAMVAKNGKCGLSPVFGNVGPDTTSKPATTPVPTSVAKPTINPNPYPTKSAATTTSTPCTSSKATPTPTTTPCTSSRTMPTLAPIRPQYDPIENTPPRKEADGNVGGDSASSAKPSATTPCPSTLQTPPPRPISPQSDVGGSRAEEEPRRPAFRRIRNKHKHKQHVPPPPPSYAVEPANDDQAVGGSSATAPVPPAPVNYGYSGQSSPVTKKPKSPRKHRGRCLKKRRRLRARNL